MHCGGDVGVAVEVGVDVGVPDPVDVGVGEPVPVGVDVLVAVGVGVAVDKDKLNDREHKFGEGVWVASALGLLDGTFGATVCCLV